MRRLLIASVLVLVVCAPTLGQGLPAKVSDLAWMTGHYKGNTGNGSLEENWAEPEGGWRPEQPPGGPVKTEMVEMELRGGKQNRPAPPSSGDDAP